MRTVSVPVVLPEWVWGRLASIAENRGVKVGDLIAGVVGELLTRKPPRTAPPRERAEVERFGILDEENA